MMAVGARRPRHVCEGVNCEHVVDTGEALVCALTGVCVGDLYVACFDYTSSSTRFNVSSTVPASSFVKNTVVVPTTAAAESEDAKGVREQLNSECYRVVLKMLVGGAVNEDRKVNVDRVFRQANGVTKKHRDGKMRLMPLVFECVRLMQEGAKPGETEHTRDFTSAVARRCADCCAMCLRLHPNATSNKVKPTYMCLAVLYMLREGVTVKGVKLCVKDEDVANKLPSLNSLSTFGYQKSKYTKAERFLRQAIEEMLFTRPLHEIRL
jgi:hypothetical protein